jgi:MFS family permease
MSQLDTRYSWLRLFISLLIAVIGNVGMWAIVVVMPDFQAEMGLDRANASLPYTFTMIGFAVGNYAIGRMVDRYGIVACLLGAAVLNSAAFYAATLTSSLWIICFIQLLLGFASAAAFGPLIADVSKWFLKRRGVAVAIAASGNYLSGAIWPLLLTGVLQTSGWQGVYLWLAALTITIMVPFSLLLSQKVNDKSIQLADAQSSNRLGALPFSARTLTWLLGLAGVGCCVAMSMPQVHIVAYCVDLGYGPTAGAEMLSLMLMGGVFSRLISGVLADRLGGVRTLLIGASLQCVGLALYLPSDGLASLYLVSLVFGLSQGGIVPSYAIIVREYLPARMAGERVGFVMMATIIGMALGGWMSGWIYDASGSYALAFWNGIAWNFLNIAIVGFISWRAMKHQN